MFEPIGFVKSCFKEKFGTPRQGNLAPFTRGYIEINKEWDPHKALMGIEAFSHAWVIFCFHDNSAHQYKPLVSPPRLGGKRLGVFATRAPMRPNPIGLTLVKIDKIEGGRLYISGLDIVEGTPVLDIKPYIHRYDSVADSKEGWLADEQLDETSDSIAVVFSEEALAQVQKHPDPMLHTTICHILQTDIRNRNDKREKNEGKTLGFFYDDINVVFCVREKTAQVLRIEPAGDFVGRSAE